LVCENVEVVDSGFVDIPNVVVDERCRGVSICSSSQWKRVDGLPELFVGIMSHESIHLTLLKIDGDSSDFLDNVASLSTIARSLGEIGVVGMYPDGMIGLDRVLEKTEEGDTG
jgi:hypothetical protein